MNPCILFRQSSTTHEELAAAQATCDDHAVLFVEHRGAVLPESLVFGRYSVLPYYRELERDLAMTRSAIVNDYAAHRWIASMAYRQELASFTFPTCTAEEYVRMHDDGPVVLKGATNSRKHEWDTMMFAKDRRTAIDVLRRLRNDPFIGQQPIVVRKYVPLVTHEVGLNGVRFANEYRFFFLGTEEIAAGYYWSEAQDISHKVPTEARELALKVAAIVAEHANFFVLDVAEKEAGGWILVEVNDAAMSGLSTIDPAHFYDRLCREIRRYVGRH